MSSLPRVAAGGASPHYPASPARQAKNKGNARLFMILFWVQFFYYTVPGNFLTPPDPTVAQENTVTMGQADPVGRILKLGVLILGIAALASRQNAVRAYLKRLNRPFQYFLILVPLSYLWSISPGDTLARYISLMSVVMFEAAFIVTAWYPTRYQDTVRPVLTALCIGSILQYLYDPAACLEEGGKGIGTLAGAWHGLTTQKNVFGPLSTLGTIFWLNALLAKQGKPLLNVAGFLICFSCVLFSHSSTSLMASVFACCFMVMLMRSPPSLKRYMPYLIGTFAGIVLTYALAVLKLVPGLDILLEPIAAATGKDMTFSNRSEIWRIIREHIQESPWIGTGYGAYWIGPDPTSPSYTFLGQMWFYPTESHNGYLELFNDLGVLGEVLLIAFLITYLRQALEILRINRAQGALYLSLFFQQAIMNLSESLWLQINAMPTFIIFTMSTLALGRLMQDKAEAARAGAFAPPARPRPAPVRASLPVPVRRF